MRLYAASIMAMRVFYSPNSPNKTVHARSTVVCLLAESAEDAEAEAFVACHTRYPEEDGWHQHTAVTIEVSEELIEGRTRE